MTSAVTAVHSRLGPGVWPLGGSVGVGVGVGAQRHLGGADGRDDTGRAVGGGAAVDARYTEHGVTPLICASKYGHAELAQVLLAAGASVDKGALAVIGQESWERETPIGTACFHGHQ